MGGPLAGRILAASGSIDFSDRTWALSGLVKTSIRKVGGFGQTGQLTAEFDSTVFRLVDPDGDELAGSYQAGAKSSADLRPDDASLIAYLTSKLERAATSVGVAVTVGTIDVTRLAARAKASSVATGIKLDLSVKIQATASVTVDGEALVVSFSTRLGGKGILETAIGGTSWVVAYVQKLSVRRLGKATRASTLRLFFGPDEGNGLGEDEFLIVVGEGATLHGTFSTDGRQKVALSPSSADRELLLSNLIEEESDGVVTHVSTSVLSQGATAKVKHGLSIALSLKVRFDAEGDVDGTRQTSGGSYALKGSGVPD